MNEKPATIGERAVLVTTGLAHLQDLRNDKRFRHYRESADRIDAMIAEHVAELRGKLQLCEAAYRSLANIDEAEGSINESIRDRDKARAAGCNI